jgi:hypothetical protein
MAIARPDGTAVTSAEGGLMPAGTYRVQLLGGPGLTPLSDPADLVVGRPQTHRTPGGPSHD